MVMLAIVVAVYLVSLGFTIGTLIGALSGDHDISPVVYFATSGVNAVCSILGIMSAFIVGPWYTWGLTGLMYAIAAYVFWDVAQIAKLTVASSTKDAQPSSPPQ